jgi:hypothetical protein
LAIHVFLSPIKESNNDAKLSNTSISIQLTLTERRFSADGD